MWTVVIRDVNSAPLKTKGKVVAANVTLFKLQEMHLRHNAWFLRVHSQIVSQPQMILSVEFR